MQPGSPWILFREPLIGAHQVTGTTSVAWISSVNKPNMDCEESFGKERCWGQNWKNPSRMAGWGEGRAIVAEVTDNLEISLILPLFQDAPC